MQAFEAKPPPLTTGSDGVVRVAATRVQLETIVQAFDAGATPEEIVQQYPSLDLRAVYAVIAYVLDNRTVVDDYVAGRQKAAETMRREVEQRWPPDGIRARLLARRSDAASR